MSAYKDSRDGTWRYRKRIKLPDGRTVRITGTPNINTRVAAEAAERAHIDRVMNPERYAKDAAKVVPERKERAVPTLKEFASRFLDEYLPREKPSAKRSKRQILGLPTASNKSRNAKRSKGSIISFFGAERLDEIDQPMINRYVASLNVASKTVNNRLSVLSSLLKYAGPHGCKLIGAVHGKDGLRFSVTAASPQIRAVPMSDVVKLYAAASDPYLRLAVRLAVDAGLRIGEIRGLQHGDVRDGKLTVRRALDGQGNRTAPKNGKPRTIPLGPALRDELARIPRRALWVISRADGSASEYQEILDAINALYVSAGVEVPKSETGQTMPWHSLRHTFGTECAARGMPLPAIKKAMGHSSIITTMRYIEVNDEQLEAAMASVFALGQQMGNSPGATADARSETIANSAGS